MFAAVQRFAQNIALMDVIPDNNRERFVGIRRRQRPSLL